jgi:hypothetical protein
MFWFFIRIRALRRLGFATPARYIILVLFVGCVMAGLIYAAVVLQAVNKRSNAPYVHAHSSSQ